MAARRVSGSLDIRARYVCGDARFLPFRDASFDAIFSYSVLQHLAETDVELVLQEVARVLRPGGVSLIQMPNRAGVRCFYHQARRGFRAPTGFEVRYWSMRSLHETFGRLVGESSATVDCFFGLGLQKADMDLMPRSWLASARSRETQAGTNTAGLTLKYLASFPARVALILRLPARMAERLLCGTIPARSLCFRPRIPIR